MPTMPVVSSCTGLQRSKRTSAIDETKLMCPTEDPVLPDTKFSLENLEEGWQLVMECPGSLKGLIEYRVVGINKKMIPVR